MTARRVPVWLLWWTNPGGMRFVELLDSYHSATILQDVFTKNDGARNCEITGPHYQKVGP